MNRSTIILSRILPLVSEQVGKDYPVTLEGHWVVFHVFNTPHGEQITYDIYRTPQDTYPVYTSTTVAPFFRNAGQARTAAVRQMSHSEQYRVTSVKSFPGLPFTGDLLHIVSRLNIPRSHVRSIHALRPHESYAYNDFVITRLM